LHSDVWLRSGVPQRYGPPESSLLDVLFRQQDMVPWFPDRMTFAEVNRWIRHMYECVHYRRQQVPQ
jgi:hypothetical protein